MLYYVVERPTHAGFKSAAVWFHDERLEIRPCRPSRPSQRFTGQQLRIAAKQTKMQPSPAAVGTRRDFYDGAGGAMRPPHGGVGLQTIRDWVLRFNARVPRLKDGKASAIPSRLKDEHKRSRKVQTQPFTGSFAAADRPGSMDFRGITASA